MADNKSFSLFTVFLFDLQQIRNKHADDRKCIYVGLSKTHNVHKIQDVPVRLHIAKSQISRTLLKVLFNAIFIFETFVTQEATKLFDVWVHALMRSQCTCCIETLWTFTANVWLLIFMLRYVHLKVSTSDELLLTNVTCEPGTFIVWPQQMCLELVGPSKTFWTVSAWVRLCTSVNTNMTLQLIVWDKQLPTVRTVIWSSVAVHLTFMCLQVAWLIETFVTQWTLVWFVSCVDSHVSD